MKTRFVTFDAAGTLVDVRWTLDGFARDCMTKLGLELPPEAYTRLFRLYGESLPEYHRINLTRDPDQGEAFWRDLTRRWFGEFGVDEKWVGPSREVAAELIAGDHYFRLYPDVLDCLNRLSRMNLRTAIVSNWDYTLHPILRTLGITDRFECVLASLEEGWEKPDPRLFDVCLKRTEVAAKHVAHVGDDMTDDVEGAIRAGLRPVYLKRLPPLFPDSRAGNKGGVTPTRITTYVPKSFTFQPEGEGPRTAMGAVITSLAELPEVLRSIG